MYNLYLIANVPISKQIIENFSNDFLAITHKFITNQNLQDKIKYYNLPYYAEVLATSVLPDKKQLYNLAKYYQIDAFFTQSNFSIKNIKILAMDMDSTLINIECIDEIADLAGVKEQVANITKQAMQGIITDFNDSLRKRVAYLKYIPQHFLNDIYDLRLKLNLGAENLLNNLHKQKTYTLLLSGGFTFFADKLKLKLNFNEAHANNLVIKDGKLTGEVNGTIIDGEQKKLLLQKAIDLHNVQKTQVMVIGDGANDMPMMSIAGFSVAFQAKEIVEQNADIAIRECGLDLLLVL